jgi:metal-dependent hydrolase (beta-lactamase superfamily II)
MLKVHVLNVEHGDSIIVEFNGSFGLIDSNRCGQRIPALEKLQALGAERLRFVALTHPHHDHYRGI